MVFGTEEFKLLLPILWQGPSSISLCNFFQGYFVFSSFPFLVLVFQFIYTSLDVDYLSFL